MKRFKRLLALTVGLIMLFAMSIVVSAASEATITVTGADGATLTYAQVIVADTTTRTGWAIADGYEEVFANFGTDEQSMIEGYMDENKSEADRLTALRNVATNTPFTNGMIVTSPGLYLINATEEGYVYNPMLAFVEYDLQDGKIVGLKNASVKAKKTPTAVLKEVLEDSETPVNKFVEIGDEITYQVTAVVPYISIDSDDTFIITDELTGGQYKLDENGQTEIQVSGEEQPRLVTPETTENGQKLVINLTDITARNEKANTVITLKYSAIVKSKVIENIAYPGDYANNATPVTSYTAKLTVTKFNEATATGDESVKLDGAEFVIVNADGKYAVITDGMLSAWADTEDEATKLTSGDDGSDTGAATVDGFDADKTYSFLEVKAPEGYSLNKETVDVQWDRAAADDSQHGYATVHDSKLMQLPYTGGSGTAMFTVVGVFMMSGAALLYFTTKRRGSNK